MNLDTEFLEKLASAEPAPGGGGASAYAGALAAALAAMVGNLAVGKPKYADEQEGILASIDRLAQLRAKLLGLVAADADAYLPLNRAYRMPRGTEDEAAARQAAIQEALGPACDIPLEIMEACSAIIDEADYLARHGSKLAVSEQTAPYPLRLPLASRLRAIPKARVPKCASPSRSHESGAPEKPSAVCAQPISEKKGQSLFLIFGKGTL